MWDPVFRVDWGNLQIHGYPLDIHGIGRDNNASRQTGTVWTGGGLGQWIPMDIHGIGIPG